MDQPLISVIIPIYKVEEYLRECLDSILSQTYTKLEIILVNDGSPDNCGSICDDFALKDSRIRVIHQEHKGLSEARNAGLDITKGDYISFVDSDDYVHPEFIGILYKGLQENVVDISVCEYTRDKFFIDKNNWDIYDFRRFYLNFPSRFAQVTSCNKLYKRSIWETLRYPAGKLHEDMFILHKLYYNRKIAYTLSSLYYHRIREGSITFNQTQKNWLNKIEALELRTQFFKDKDKQEYYKHTFQWLVYTQARAYRLFNNLRAKEFLKQNLTSLIVNPILRNKEKLLILALLTNRKPVEKLNNWREKFFLKK